MQKTQGNEKILITEEAVLLIFAKDIFKIKNIKNDMKLRWRECKKRKTLFENLKLFTVFITGKKLYQQFVNVWNIFLEIGFLS